MPVSSLSTFGLAKKNIQRQPRRSFCLILTVLLFSFALYAGSVLAVSLSGGVESLANRLGADIIVVPEGYDPHIDSILLSGKPTSFYLPKNIFEMLSGIQGIDRMTTQTFLATLSASCCSYPVQLVGIDYKTDFLIKPWLEETLHRDLKDGELILGYHVSGQPGDSLTFFKKSYKAVGRLEQTGMGFDLTVFMTQNTIAELAKAAERIIKRPLADDGSLVSTVLIRLAPGYDSVAVAKEINKKLNDHGVYALFSKRFVNKVTSSLNLVSGLIVGVVALVWMLAVVVIALLFAMSLGERRREMGTLRVLGATRGHLVRFCLAEVFLVSLYGALPGAGLGALAVLAVSPMMTEALKLPFLLPSWPQLLGLAAVSVALAVMTSLLSALGSARKASRADIYDCVREA